MMSRVADDELLAQFPEVARHAKHVFLLRSLPTTSFLQDCLSDETESLYINVGLDGGWIDLPADALTALSHSPRLKELTIPAPSSGEYSPASSRAVFSHPSLEQLQMGGRDGIPREPTCGGQAEPTALIDAATLLSLAS